MVAVRLPLISGSEVVTPVGVEFRRSVRHQPGHRRGCADRWIAIPRARATDLWVGIGGGGGKNHAQRGNREPAIKGHVAAQGESADNEDTKQHKAARTA